MYVLRIEHPVPDFEGWKRAFDSDPVGRQRGGVRRYSILRPLDDRNYVMIDLEFESEKQAAQMLTELRTLWKRVEGQVMMNPETRIVEIVEKQEF